jgi:hypothetical protein
MQQNADAEGNGRSPDTRGIAQKTRHSIMKSVQERENPQ